MSSSSRMISFGDGRKLLSVPPRALTDEEITELSFPVAALLLVHDDRHRETYEAIALQLVVLGCAEICCVGVFGESLHDAVDEIIEDRGAFGVVTTWHPSVIEGFDYFLAVAGGQPRCVVAFGDETLDVELARALHPQG